MIAALVQGPLGRLLPVAFLILSLQTTVFADVRPAGVSVQVLLALAAAAGVAGGPEQGMLAGFVCGLLFDLGVGTPLGSSAITMGLAGLVAGSAAFLNVEMQWWLAGLFVALGAAVGEFSVPMVRLLIGEETVLSDRLFTVVPVVAVSAALMSPLLVPVTRWCLRISRSEWKMPVE
jgi:rod shape-determining protein MreD